MNPTPSDVHVDFVLTNISVAWLQGQQDFVGEQVFPSVPVQNQSNNYRVYDRDDWFRVEAQERAPATESVGGGWRLSTDNYNARVYAFHKDVDDQTRANADADIDIDRDATEYVTRQLALKQEKLWVDTYFKTGVWGTDVTGIAGAPGAGQVRQWSVAGSTPIEDVAAYRMAMAQATGFRPNTLILSPQVLTALANHAEILERIKYTERGIVTTDLLAALFGVERVLIPWGIINTAAEGTTGVYSFMFNSAALLVYTPPRAGVLQPAAGYTFVWNGYLGMEQGTRITRFRMENIKSDRVEGERAFDMKVVAPTLGVFFASLA